MKKKAIFSGCFSVWAVWGCSFTGCQTQHALNTEKLESYSLGATPNVHVYNGVLLAGQPGKDDLKLAKEIGVKTVVSLRDKSELNWDEESEVKGLGLDYQNVAIKGPEALNDGIFDQIRGLLKDSSKRPLLLHCASAGRVGTMWLAHRVLDDGVQYETALQEAKAVGLAKPEFEAKAKDYIDRHKK
ncbi:MAG: hypothetical protein HY717_02135 [Planctomycetes bacterium]|nr:hypothetical protein [Planctomycetota bacterium]